MRPGPKWPLCADLREDSRIARDMADTVVCTREVGYTADYYREGAFHVHASAAAAVAEYDHCITSVRTRLTLPPQFVVSEGSELLRVNSEDTRQKSFSVQFPEDVMKDMRYGQYWVFRAWLNVDFLYEVDGLSHRTATYKLPVDFRVAASNK